MLSDSALIILLAVYVYWSLTPEGQESMLARTERAKGWRRICVPFMYISYTPRKFAARERARIQGQRVDQRQQALETSDVIGRIRERQSRPETADDNDDWARQQQALDRIEELDRQLEAAQGDPVRTHQLLLQKEAAQGDVLPTYEARADFFPAEPSASTPPPTYVETLAGMVGIHTTPTRQRTTASRQRRNGGRDQTNVISLQRVSPGQRT